MHASASQRALSLPASQLPMDRYHALVFMGHLSPISFSIQPAPFLSFTFCTCPWEKSDRAIVYDSLEAPARPLMLRRTATHDAGNGASADAPNASRGSGGAGVEPLPGTAGRWQYGEEDEVGRMVIQWAVRREKRDNSCGF